MVNAKSKINSTYEVELDRKYKRYIYQCFIQQGQDHEELKLCERHYV